MKEEFCCNCHWYDGVHGCQGCAECKIKHEIVLWSDCCDHLWLIPERLKIGLKTNANRIRNMTDEEMAEWLIDKFDCDLADVPCREHCHGGKSCEETLLEWLKSEA